MSTFMSLCSQHRNDIELVAFSFKIVEGLSSNIRKWFIQCMNILGSISRRNSKSVDMHHQEMTKHDTTNTLLREIGLDASRMCET